MKSDRIKKGLFVVLGLIAVYIWWGNIDLMFNQGKVYQIPATKSNHSSISSSGSNAQLPFRKVRINPFRRMSITQNQQQPTQTKNNDSPPPHPLHLSYFLTGILHRGQSSQAVLETNDGQSLVLSVNDSIQNWELKQVESDHAIFHQGRYHDTLRLNSITSPR